MSTVNKVILIGRLGKDPEVRHTQDGTTIVNMNVATSENWKNKATGEKKQKTEWHRIVMFGKLAELAEQYLRKGDQVYIEGSLQTRKWQDKNGADRYTTEVVLNPFNGVMRFLAKAGDSNAAESSTVDENPAQTAADPLNDEIPF